VNKSNYGILPNLSQAASYTFHKCIWLTIRTEYYIS